MPAINGPLFLEFASFTVHRLTGGQPLRKFRVQIHQAEAAVELTRGARAGVNFSPLNLWVIRETGIRIPQPYGTKTSR